MSPVLDHWQRPLRDLRVSVTDRCNFRCTYCMPAAVFGADYPFLRASQLMKQEELQGILSAFVGLGTEKLRFTGGEPLLRADLPELIAYVSRTLGVRDLALTTNGWALERLAGILREAGLTRLNVSLDSLDPAIFGRMTGLGFKPDRVLRGIAAAQDAGFAVKINMVVQRGENDHEIESMAAWARERRLTLRFIEFMDVGNHNEWRAARVVPAREILDRLNARWPLRPLVPAYRGEVAARYGYEDGGGEIGLISSITEPFCKDCNRARLSADGRLFTCLFAQTGADVLGEWRRTQSVEAVRLFLTRSWAQRKDRYSDERADRLSRGEQVERIEMSYIGG